MSIPRTMSTQTVYQLAMESAGAPEQLARIVAASLSSRPNSTASADKLARGLYRYFINSLQY